MEIKMLDVLDLLASTYPRHASVFDGIRDVYECMKDQLAQSANQGYEILELRNEIEQLRTENAQLKALTPDFLGGTESTETYDLICDECNGSYISHNTKAKYCQKCRNKMHCNGPCNDPACTVCGDGE